ncbi:MAG TPA: ATP-binding protein [Saprospiraceae bacterium]|nr:ATP-binding protein [Saprospiraceae bacterium]
MPTITTTELRKVICLQDLPEELLQWMLEHGEYHEYPDGSILTRTGEPIDHLWLIMEGKGMFYKDFNGRLIHYYTFENNTTTGGAGGLLPYSRMKASPGFTFATGQCRIFSIHKQYFQELERLNPDFIQRLIGYMTERARSFATQQLQEEKISALGRLSAGVAHELNNPSAAITRLAIELKKKLLLNYKLTENILLLEQLDPVQVEQLREKTISLALQTATGDGLTTLQKVQRENDFSDWLVQGGFGDNRLISETFTTAGWTVDDLQQLLATVGPDAFLPLLLWLENLLTASWQLSDLEEASSRISTLVSALKSHVHMDRTTDKVPTNLHRDIDNTLTLLGFKWRQKNITITKKYTSSLPEIEAYVGELNQVWSNLIDNAIHALDTNGELTIETAVNEKDVLVRIRDNGHGIPPEVLPHIFEPYYTTKDVGEGSGIGLDIVQRVIRNHLGQIHVTSVPGNTEFTIVLPLIPKETLSYQPESKIPGP